MSDATDAAAPTDSATLKYSARFEADNDTVSIRRTSKCVVDDPVLALWQSYTQNELLPLSSHESDKLRHSLSVLEGAQSAGSAIYGITHGFGPLVAHGAAADGRIQGFGLISHLATGQGQALPPEICQLVFRLRLEGLRRGYSGISPDFWQRLAAFYKSGFAPLIQRDGTVSASGDLQPLAQAALALTGRGRAYVRSGLAWQEMAAGDAIRQLGLEPLVFDAREALSFVNGTTVCLAATLNNHVRIVRFARALTLLSARMAVLLGSNPEHFSHALSEARGQLGQLEVAARIRSDANGALKHAKGRTLQEPYSLRCAPQVIGAALDTLRMHGQALTAEALNCTDNPVIAEDGIYHGGNFHAMPVAFASDMQGLALQQMAFLAERQLNLIVTPETNGGLPPLLTPTPGAQSGLAGVQISATSFVSRIRQLVQPATLTTLPTNLHNQDHVPMALNGANGVADAIDLAWLVIGSLGVSVAQWTHLAGTECREKVWHDLAQEITPVDSDRPLAPDVRLAAQYFENIAANLLDEETPRA